MGIKAAAFDTRIPKSRDILGILRLMINLFGHAQIKIFGALSKTGADLVLESSSFDVKDPDGPLMDSDLARAKDWGKEIL